MEEDDDSGEENKDSEDKEVDKVEEGEVRSSPSIQGVDAGPEPADVVD